MHTETTRQDRTSKFPPALGTAVVVGLAVAMGTVGRRKGLRERPHEDERCGTGDVPSRAPDRRGRRDSRRRTTAPDADGRTPVIRLAIQRVRNRPPGRPSHPEKAGGLVRVAEAAVGSSVWLGVQTLGRRLGGRSVTVSDTRSARDRSTGQAVHVARTPDATARSATAWNSKPV